MLKTTTLRKNYEFGRVFQKGQHVATRTLGLPISSVATASCVWA
jgi:RNase P protein component